MISRIFPEGGRGQCGAKGVWPLSRLEGDGYFQSRTLLSLKDTVVYDII
jgi:hypothetical protein